MRTLFFFCFGDLSPTGLLLVCLCFWLVSHCPRLAIARRVKSYQPCSLRKSDPPSCPIATCSFVFPFCLCLLAENKKQLFFIFFCLCEQGGKTKRQGVSGARLSPYCSALGGRSSSAVHKCFCCLVPASSGIKKSKAFFAHRSARRKKQFYERTAKRERKSKKRTE